MKEIQNMDREEFLRWYCEKNGIELKEFREDQKTEAERNLRRISGEIKRQIPELIGALNLLVPFATVIPISLSTDFEHLFYHPQLVNKLAATEIGRLELQFQLMHILIHGLLGDNDIFENEKNSPVIHLAIDQRANKLCGRLGFPSTDRDRLFYLRMMEENKPYQSCFGNYRLAGKNKAVRKKAGAAKRLIASDEHFFWIPLHARKLMNASPGTLSDEEKGENGNFDKQKTAEKWREARSVFLEDQSKNSGFLSEKDLDRCAKRAKGNGAGCFSTDVKAAGGDGSDYTELLKELLTPCEDPREIPDSIDPMLYCYGLDLFDDVPLVEPREGDERYSNKLFCIAIDTSGSCEGTVAMKFLREVREIFAISAGLFRQGEILFLQCDCRIQEEKRFELNDFINPISEEMRLKGWGGTSFIPVFERLNKLVEDGEEIGGLIYLTDGYGDYPREKPTYPVIFVMNEEDYLEHKTNYAWRPDWVRLGVIDD